MSTIAAARSRYVNDKHLATLPRPTRWTRRPYQWTTAGSDDAWEKAEDYFNQQAAQGWQLVKVGPLRWGFAPCQPGEFVYRIAFLEEVYGTPASQTYLTLLVDSGAEVVDIQKYLYAVTRRPAALGPYVIEGSTSSRLSHLRETIKRATYHLITAFGIMTTLAVIMGVLSVAPIALGPDGFNSALFMCVLGLVSTLPEAWIAYASVRRSLRKMGTLIADTSIHE